MKRSLFLTTLALGSCFCFGLVHAQQNGQQAVLEKTSLGTAYIPVGFDNINSIQIMVEGAFMNTCYRVGPNKVQVSNNTITVTQGAYHYKGFCGDMIVPYSHVVDLGLLDIGNYTVVDGKSGRILGKLPVVNAPPKSPATYPDDYLYAPISDASLLINGGQAGIVLSGAFTDDCTHMTEIKTQVFGNVIQVLPITERGTTACNKGFYPFQMTKTISVREGHYLLYVRSLSGNAVSKMVDVY